MVNLVLVFVSLDLTRKNQFSLRPYPTSFEGGDITKSPGAS